MVDRNFPVSYILIHRMERKRMSCTYIYWFSPLLIYSTHSHYMPGSIPSTRNTAKSLPIRSVVHLHGTGHLAVLPVAVQKQRKWVTWGVDIYKHFGINSSSYSGRRNDRGKSRQWRVLVLSHRVWILLCTG